MEIGEFPEGLSLEEITGDELILFKIFNVDLDPECRPNEKQPSLNDGVRVPLWHLKKRKVKRVASDNIKPGISTNEPGSNYRVISSYGTISRLSARAEDLARFYEKQPQCNHTGACDCQGESAFDLED